ncbi:hypothetical protein JTE90_012367 [Oedothorax gibbosus]|uniref:Uncharacterized protein n=1 Tax=Oedothorax gibbosus TaxID=931172 RepID=A0AAV6USA6_9ARAC|nr:hypothetical protein JTE90_012367 [Oedothorax gibbosus]
MLLSHKANFASLRDRLTCEYLFCPHPSIAGIYPHHPLRSISLSKRSAGAMAANDCQRQRRWMLMLTRTTQ